MIWLTTGLFPLIAMGSALVVVVSLLKFVMEIQRDMKEHDNS
jgi:hypothetical protein